MNNTLWSHVKGLVLWLLSPIIAPWREAKSNATAERTMSQLHETRLEMTIDKDESGLSAHEHRQQYQRRRKALNDARIHSEARRRNAAHEHRQEMTLEGALQRGSSLQNASESESRASIMEAEDDNLDWEFLLSVAKSAWEPETSYDQAVDRLVVCFDNSKQQWNTLYLDGELALLVEPGGRRVVGFLVEAFEQSFLLEHNTLRLVWRLDGQQVPVTDFPDLTLRYDEMRRKVAREVVKAATTTYPNMPQLQRFVTMLAAFTAAWAGSVEGSPSGSAI